MHQSLNFFPNQLNMKSPSGVSAAAVAAAAALSNSNSSAFNAAKLAVSLFPSHQNNNNNNASTPPPQSSSQLNPFSIESLLSTAPAAAAAAAVASQQYQQRMVNSLNSPTGQKNAAASAHNPSALYSPLQTTADIYGIFSFFFSFVIIYST